MHERPQALSLRFSLWPFMHPPREGDDDDDYDDDDDDCDDNDDDHDDDDDSLCGLSCIRPEKMR